VQVTSEYLRNSKFVRISLNVCAQYNLTESRLLKNHRSLVIFLQLLMSLYKREWKSRCWKSVSASN